MQRFFVRLAYDGSNFHGWQRQPNAMTVQQKLEDAMTMLLKRSVVLTGAGRTDQGVHAHDFFAHFDSEQDMSVDELEKFSFRLNRFLGGEVVIYSIFPVPSVAHARFSAVSRTYSYCVARVQNPFRRNYTHFIYGDLDVDGMNQGADIIRETRDFTSFSKVDTDTMTNLCKVTQAFWKTEAGELVFTITADRFLRNMVRAIVGTLLQIGRGRLNADDLIEIIEKKDRSAAGDSAPAKGLTLSRIVYPKDILCFGQGSDIQ